MKYPAEYYQQYGFDGNGVSQTVAWPNLHDGLASGHEIVPVTNQAIYSIIPYALAFQILSWFGQYLANQRHLKHAM
jgi:hypothetical protein